MEINQTMKTRTRSPQKVQTRPYERFRPSYTMSADYLRELSRDFGIPLHRKFINDKGYLINAVSNSCNKERKNREYVEQNSFHGYHLLMLSKHAVAHLEDRGYWIEQMHLEPYSKAQNNHISNIVQGPAIINQRWKWQVTVMDLNWMQDRTNSIMKHPNSLMEFGVGEGFQCLTIADWMEWVRDAHFQK